MMFIKCFDHFQAPQELIFSYTWLRTNRLVCCRRVLVYLNCQTGALTWKESSTWTSGSWSDSSTRRDIHTWKTCSKKNKTVIFHHRCVTCACFLFIYFFKQPPSFVGQTFSDAFIVVAPEKNTLNFVLDVHIWHTSQLRWSAQRSMNTALSAWTRAKVKNKETQNFTGCTWSGELGFDLFSYWWGNLVGKCVPEICSNFISRLISGCDSK